MTSKKRKAPFGEIKYIEKIELAMIMALNLLHAWIRRVHR
jgi:hypothetical protein